MSTYDHHTAITDSGADKAQRQDERRYPFARRVSDRDMIICCRFLTTTAGPESPFQIPSEQHQPKNT